MFDRYISFAARQTPYLIAASDGSEHVSYRELDRVIGNIAVLLAETLGSDRLIIVGLSVRDGYRHALLALACARLGFASASLFAHQVGGTALLAGVGIVVTDEPDSGDWGGARLVADANWFARAHDAPGAGTEAVEVDHRELARVQLSSGTTGQPKAVDVSWAALDARIASGFFGDGDAMRRVLTLIGPESGSLQLMLTTWKMRGCVLFAPNPAAGAVAAALPVLRPTGLLISPAQLSALIEALPADAPPMVGLEIAVAGGRMSRSLADRAAVRLGARVTSVYASTEAGTTALGYAATLPDDGAVGYVTPATRVAIVDDDGRPLPRGIVGRVRVMGPELASGYRDGSAGAVLGDGMFHPGDLGSLDDDGLLRIAGREDEVINLGGEKFLPDVLEACVRPVPGVADVAAFALEDESGVARPWLAVVRDGPVEEGAIGRALVLPGLPPVRVAWIDAIPRTLMGKIQREPLRQAARLLHM
jgi:2,3-dihydroxybenzoate-AMP ligase